MLSESDLLRLQQRAKDMEADGGGGANGLQYGSGHFLAAAYQDFSAHGGVPGPPIHQGNRFLTTYTASQFNAFPVESSPPTQVEPISDMIID